MNTDNHHSDDLAILAALEELERGIDSPRVPRADETAETLTRLYTEVLGLVPYEVEPATPSAGAKARLMSMIHGDETQPASEPAPVPARAGAPAPVAPIRPAQEARAPRAPVSGAYAVSRGGGRWPLALAAALAFALLGLSAWLYLQVQRQNEIITALNRDLATERSHVQQVMGEIRQVRTAAQELQDKFAIATFRAAEVCPMRPVGDNPVQPNARGVLYVAEDHQHWYLALRNLAPAQEGQTYKLWFVAEQGTFSGGTFTARPGSPMELSSKEMPVNTKGVVITLEEDEETPVPAGPEILRATAVYQLS